MFGQPFVLRQLGNSGLFSNGPVLNLVILLLIALGISALVCGGFLLAKAPDPSPRVHVKAEHRRRGRRRRKQA